MSRVLAPLLLPVSALLLQGCGPRYLPAEATVVSIERRCALEGPHEYKGDLRYADCTRDPKFAARRANFDDMTSHYIGTATITVGYISPVDNSSQRATLTFDGNDREFYFYRVNDPIRIEVRQDDHLRIRPG
jgi:hypothetical protein